MEETPCRSHRYEDTLPASSFFESPNNDGWVTKEGKTVNTRRTIGSTDEEITGTPGNPIHHRDDHSHRDETLATPGNPIPHADHDQGDGQHDHHHELGYN
jgi:hypothetical protein